MNRHQNRSRQTQVKLTFDTLEDRRLLAADFIQQVTGLISVDQRESYLRTHLDLGQNESMNLIDTYEDQIGFTHYKFQQMLNDIPVDGGVYSVHSKDGRLVSLSGNYVPITDTFVGPQVDSSRAFRAALHSVGADTYVWSDPGSVAYDDITLAEARTGELVYFMTDDGQSLLAYQFDVFAIEPFSRDYVFVDARTGTDIIATRSRIRFVDVAATGVATYEGIVDITVDKTGRSPYRTVESENRFIKTLDVNNGTDTSTAIPFESSDDTFDLPSHDDGVQVHYGVETFYDYLLNVHGRNSIDGDNHELKSFVNFDVDYTGAVWMGGAARFGDGDGVTTGSWTSLDIVGHEFTHGLTESTAGLLSTFQAGALSESFADIFGSAVERHARGSQDWAMGADIMLDGSGGVRNLADPKIHNHPDTFQGEFWDSNGDAHINSGVPNKWFYMLADGEAGTNDLGDVYDVSGIGFDSAAAIAFRNLTVYLNRDAKLEDARLGSIQSAIDLYGAGSLEQLATEEAWFAVGVGMPDVETIEIGDLTAVRSLGSQIYVGSATGEIVAHTGDELNPQIRRDVYKIRLDANQTLSAAVQGTDLMNLLLPLVRIVSPSGTLISEASSIDDLPFAAARSVEVFESGSYTVIVSGGDTGTFGDYNLDVYLNADIELESYTGISNDDSVNAQDINTTPTPFNESPAKRLAVVGEIELDEIGGVGSIPDPDAVFSGGLEMGFLDSSWTRNYVFDPLDPDTPRRIEVDNFAGVSEGMYALYMDSRFNGIYALNEAIWTVDLSTVSTPYLNFDYAEFFDETDTLPDVFLDHEDGDGVSISVDGTTWYTLLNSTQSANGVWESASFDLVGFAETVGIELGDNVQFKFQQYDNQPIEIADGRGFDNISISLSPRVQGTGAGDWFAIELQPGQSILLTTAKRGLNGPVVGVDLYEAGPNLVRSSGDFLANDVLTNVDAYIDPYTHIDVDPATYFINVRSSLPLDYSLVVTLDSVFDVETSGFDPLVQDITDVSGAFGYLTSGAVSVAEADDFDPGTRLDNRSSGVVLSDNVSGAGVYSSQDVIQQFSPPTGVQVFTHNPSGSGPWQETDGWQEDQHEFRADFLVPQQFVSIQFTSDEMHGPPEVAWLGAYSADGTLLDEDSTTASRFENKTLSITRSIADIAYVIAAGDDGDSVPLDDFVYQTEIDIDVYRFEAEVGEEINFGGFIPGQGPHQFVNGLDLATGSTLRLELIDPGGVVIESGSRIIQTVATVPGEYLLRVTATSGEGEYYINKSPVSSLVGVDFGPVQSPIWQNYTFVNDDNYDVGLGYGWTATSKLSFSMHRRGNDLNRDFAQMRTATFVIDAPNAMYEIDVNLGLVRHADLMHITIEGVTDDFVPRRGRSVIRSYTVLVTDGQLTFEFSGIGGLSSLINVSGISIEEVLSGSRFVPPAASSGVFPTGSLANRWGSNEAVFGSKLYDTGFKEIWHHVSGDIGGRKLLGSQQLITSDHRRDLGFASAFPASAIETVRQQGRSHELNATEDLFTDWLNEAVAFSVDK